MLSVKFIEVEPIAGVLQELSISFNEDVCPFAKTKVIGKALMTKYSLLWVKPIPHYGLKGMG